MAMLPSDRKLDTHSGKILLPPSALHTLSQLHIQYPMLFELASRADPSKYTHAGVLEFIAEEGRIYVPQWMMNHLLLQEGDLIHIKSATLPLGTFVKIQPQSTAFLDISDPKAVLENAFRSFSTLTKGDLISISYNNKTYEILVLEIKPDVGRKGISIIETDLEVDFAPPLGYIDPADQKKQQQSHLVSQPPSLSGSTNLIEQHIVKDADTFSAFKGSGQKLNGKDLKNDTDLSSMTAAAAGSSGIPASLHLPIGKIFLGYPIKPFKKEGEGGEDKQQHQFFEGKGISLREAKKKGNNNGE